MSKRGLALVLMVVTFVLVSPARSSGAQYTDSFGEIRKIHDSGITGAGYSIALIDFGFDTTHPYFQGAKIVEVRIGSDGTVRIGDGVAKANNGSHGIAAAGAVVGRTSSASDAISLYGKKVRGGWAPGATLIMITWDTYGNNSLGEERAFNWVADNYQKYKIVAVSLASYQFVSREWLPSCGGKLFPRAWEGPLARLLATPVALVNAAGNLAQVDNASYPGCLPQAVSVSSYDDPLTDRAVNFTNLDPRSVSIIGPCCYMSATQDGWDLYSGTSSTTPVIASLFALANQARPGISREEVMAAMRESADRYVELGYEFPILNIPRFFARLKDPRAIDTSMPLKGAFNAPSATPTPTVTITATPGPAPTVTVTSRPSPAATVILRQIVCSRGTQLKRVTAVKPKCPVGWRKK